MGSFSQLWSAPGVRSACARLAAAATATVDEAIAIQQIPAPTFEEMERARYVHDRFSQIGLEEVETDEIGNVYGCISGAVSEGGLLISAHLDTVFSRDTDLAVRIEGDRVYGPGIGDNSLGVAGLLALAAELVQSSPPRTIWLVANVGEEGLGNLRGMWSVMRRLQKSLSAVVVLEGAAYGTIVHKGIGVERRRIIVETQGGHSWSNFGVPSAIHELCRVGNMIAALTVPEIPRTTFNLGIIEGGTAINTIAARASALLDLRSEEPASLSELSRRVDDIIRQARSEGVEIHSEVIGERPAGEIAPSHPLVRAAESSLYHLGYIGAKLRPGSTDANVPLAMGIPAVCIGLVEGHDAHRVTESIEPAVLRDGLQHAYLVARSALELSSRADAYAYRWDG
jgi:tripeptide aminopeptidase